jgi:tRNA(fMet)-specific endonuclease VapC
MTIAPVVLDTDTLSFIMRQDPTVLPKARNYLAIHQQFTFTIITRYEILRGLKAKNAFKQLENFDRLCAVSTILPLTDAAIVEAADIYAHLKNQGTLIMDADILIAASAIVRGMKIVTNNERHFQRIPNIQVENWLR